MNQDLVSIVLVSFNSSNYINAALNSIFNQTYHQIELLISDDCSTDNTVSIATNWLSTHANRFVSTKILKADINKGTASNINKGIMHSMGKWIIPLAADDVLKNNYVQDMVDFFLANSKIKIAYSNVEYIDSNGKVISERLNYYSKFNLNSTTALLQHAILLRYNPVFAPSLMFDRIVIEQYGLFDERFPLCEDLFFLLKITSMGEKIYYNPKRLLQYRKHQNSVQVKNKLILRKYDIDYWLGLKEYAFNSYGIFERFLVKFIWHQLQTVQKFFNNKVTLMSNFWLISTTIVPRVLLRIIRIRYYLSIRPIKCAHTDITSIN